MIRVIKLKTGEEVIADIDGISKVGDIEKVGDEISMNKPMSLHLIPQQEGLGISLIPWVLYAKDHSKIPYLGSEVVFCNPS